MNDKTMYTEQIDFLNNAITQIDNTRAMERIKEKLECEKFRIQSSLGAVLSNLRIYEQKPDLTDGEIDIYLNSNEGDIAFRGIIYLHDTPLEVGVIDYRGPCDSKWLGDIGYTINEEYRGNNYAYKALELISPVISEKGIDKVTITTYSNNIPSIKTIEKFDGVLKETTLAEVLIYECDLNHILINSSETHANNK